MRARMLLREHVVYVHVWAGVHNRRRGFDYFLNNTILFHNYNPLHNPAVDLTLSEDESQVMNLLIPLVEINSNNLID